MKHDLIRKNLDQVYKLFSQVDSKVDLESDAITVFTEDELSSEQCKAISDAAKSLLSWRQGPYKLFDLLIDAEWQSNLKWQRLKSILGDLSDLEIADVGCGNGYFLFKSLSLSPKSATGFDPFQNCNYQFQLLDYFIKDSRAKFIQKGVEDLSEFSSAFDLVMYMGVLYHRKDPVASLRNIFQALKPGGSLILETLVMPGDESPPYTISDRYAKMPNVYHLTSPAGLIDWVTEAGFSNCEVHSISQTSIYEQRQTEFSPFESLADYLNQEKQLETVEGLPAPRKILIKAYV